MSNWPGQDGHLNRTLPLPFSSFSRRFVGLPSSVSMFLNGKHRLATLSAADVMSSGLFGQLDGGCKNANLAVTPHVCIHTCANDLSSGGLLVQRHVWSLIFPHGGRPSVVCALTNLVCVFKEKLCLGVELPHIDTRTLSWPQRCWSAIGTDRVVRLRCVAHHHVTGRRVLLSPAHTDTHRKRETPPSVWANVNIISQVQWMSWHYCYLWVYFGEMFNGAHMPNSGKALSLTTVSVFDTSFLSALPIGHFC